MNGGMRAATAIGVGYLLGRRKKFRTATLMAAATAVGGTTVGGLVMRRGMKMLNNTDALNKVAPQLGELAETVRGDLLGAGKAAASAAVSNRVDALTDSLHDHAERLRNPEAVVAEGADQAAEAGRAAGRSGKRAAAGAGSTARRAAGRGRSRSRDEEEDYESGDADYEADEAGQSDDEAEDYDDAEEQDDRADEPDDRGEDDAPPRRSAARRRSPVGRARR
jgi:hypothetical protein